MPRNHMPLDLQTDPLVTIDGLPLNPLAHSKALIRSIFFNNLAVLLRWFYSLLGDCPPSPCRL